MKNYSEIAREYHSGFAKLAGDIPDTAKAFGALVGAATGDGVLSRKVKELIAFGIAITVRCDGCIAAHAAACHEAGATRQEVAEMVGVALLMGGGPSSVYGVEAMRAYDEVAAAKA
ncbi:carboxymuconolactone decarboxylase family protein [Paenirhodobacter sp. CAU 1674]|uniref:carboxymuconolactone decarboxylase family protein n=1 Tax=Paenirhodobacter sp. CAU 1674 TaxID=3032596 RepID=UPI0023DC43F1|nr:carboxymuconolactone decarboxylase family protein [Paenirhodobacter sp. CAU 1674]MDF2141395.1 carboxymuconolactone decarboxylase family protein [Paenirhodobacter sp. CAU 1674]